MLRALQLHIVLHTHTTSAWKASLQEPEQIFPPPPPQGDAGPDCSPCCAGSEMAASYRHVSLGCCDCRSCGI